MTDMWRSRVPPTPLDFDSISQDGDVSMTPTLETSGSTPGAGGSTSNLKDQKVLSLADNLDLFVSRYFSSSNWYHDALLTIGQHQPSRSEITDWRRDY
jgi:hypothetical protein